MPDTNSATQQAVADLGQRWADAEQRGDADALTPLLTDEFVAIGPLGFVLDRQQYLAGRRSGELKLEGFGWQPGATRDYGEVAVVVGVVTQRAIFQGQPQPPASGRFRTTHIAVRHAGTWRLGGIQFSGPMPEAPAGQAPR
jgi:hypothetical protein